MGMGLVIIIKKQIRNVGNLAVIFYECVVGVASWLRGSVETRMKEAKGRETGRFGGIRLFFALIYAVAVDAAKILGFFKTLLVIGGVVAFGLVGYMAHRLYDTYAERHLLDGHYSLDYPRPPYYGKGRVLRISNLVIPIYMDSVNSYRKVELDLSVVTGNKYIREYLDANSHLVLSVLSSNIEPIDAEFLLDKEGKRVMADKIKRELTKLLKSLRIKGVIEGVYIHYMFAG